MDGEHKGRVLVVEDDVDMRRILRLILEDAGYTVTEAADGLAAVACLRSDTGPLVVLLDWWLPKLDGIGVLRAVGHDVLGMPRHEYILMTAAYETLASELAHAASNALAPVLPKPFRLKDLREVVAMAARELHRREGLGTVAGGDDG